MVRGERGREEAAREIQGNIRKENGGKRRTRGRMRRNEKGKRKRGEFTFIRINKGNDVKGG